MDLKTILRKIELKKQFIQILEEEARLHGLNGRQPEPPCLRNYQENLQEVRDETGTRKNT